MDVVELLLANEGQVNAEDKVWTALHGSAARGHKDLVEESVCAEKLAQAL
jgi:hypothetical protein